MPNNKTTISIGAALTLMMIGIAVYTTMFTAKGDTLNVISKVDDKVDVVASNLKTHETVADMMQKRNDVEHKEFKACIAEQTIKLDSVIKVLDKKILLDTLYQNKVLEALEEIKDNGN